MRLTASARLVPLGLTLATLAIAGSVVLAVPAGNWPQWRGPKRDGISTEVNLLQSWPAGGPPKAWVASGLGAGYSSVSIADGRIFTMGDRRDGQYVFGLNEANGQQIWACVGESRVMVRCGAFAGVITVTAAEQRSQLRNREIALAKLAGLVAEGLAPEAARRRATKPTRGSNRRRLAAKEQRAATKQQRRRPSAE